MWISLLFIFCNSIKINIKTCGRNELTMQDLDELMLKAKELLKDEMSRIAFDTWIKPLTIEKKEGNTYFINAVSIIHRDSVTSRYYDLIVNTDKYITNN